MEMFEIANTCTESDIAKTISFTAKVTYNIISESLDDNMIVLTL